VSAAERKRLYRKRRKGGLTALTIVVDKVAITEELIRLGYMRSDPDDWRVLNKAIEQAEVVILPFGYASRQAIREGDTLVIELEKIPDENRNDPPRDLRPR